MAKCQYRYYTCIILVVGGGLREVSYLDTFVASSSSMGAELASEGGWM